MKEIIAAVLGAFAGCGLTYFGTVRLHLNSLKITEGSKLRAAFSEELFALQDGSRWVRNKNHAELLKSAYSKHAIAVNEYAHYLRGKEAEGFIKAWEKYLTFEVRFANTNLIKEIIDTSFTQYAPVGDLTYNREKRKLAVKRIEAILEYTIIKRNIWHSGWTRIGNFAKNQYVKHCTCLTDHMGK